MAVGSWIGSDIFPMLELFKNIIERGSSRSRKGKGKVVVRDSMEEVKMPVPESDDDTDFEWKGEKGYDSLGARGGVPSRYIASTSQGNGRCTQHVPTRYISSTFRIFPANFHAVSPAQEMVRTFTVSQVM